MMGPIATGDRVKVILPSQWYGRHGYALGPFAGGGWHVLLDREAFGEASPLHMVFQALPMVFQTDELEAL